MTMPPRARQASIAAGNTLTSVPSDSFPSRAGATVTATTSGGMVVANSRGTCESRAGT